ncbi:hypothetical protein BDV36DRAFT_14136 [Aspergillus pseudocaelatus]|uniref:Major facilitator superfamily (MFS) profile domain-containing protein n=1 Tax=Aspergillus pseudocaelatus TaxID=1825620 RepID=A0ABQ6WAM1_9EURO|nr:hypothetical protein BDV36DRAFT_14136 [Aspergillus pseudocaelatus]
MDLFHLKEPVKWCMENTVEFAPQRIGSPSFGSFALFSAIIPSNSIGLLQVSQAEVDNLEYVSYTMSNVIPKCSACLFVRSLLRFVASQDVNDNGTATVVFFFFLKKKEQERHILLSSFGPITDGTVVRAKQNRNDPFIDKWRLLAIFISFAVVGASDGAYGALVPHVCTEFIPPVSSIVTSNSSKRNSAYQLRSFLGFL